MKAILSRHMTYDVEVEIDLYCEEFKSEYLEWLGEESNDEESRREWVIEQLYDYMDDFIMDAIDGRRCWVELLASDVDLVVDTADSR